MICCIFFVHILTYMSEKSDNSIVSTKDLQNPKVVEIKEINYLTMFNRMS